MKDVMRECDRGQQFDAYAYCIKSTYNAKGNTPNNTAVRAFYANLDMIAEAYRTRRISDAQAKSLAWDSYLKTIQASNDRKDAIFWNQMNMMQQQQPIQTQCIRQGIVTTCTTN